MTEPKALSQEQRAELVAKAKAATPGPWFHCQPSMVVPKQRTIHGPVPARRVDYVSTWADMGTPPGHRVVLPMPGEEGPSVRSLDMAFIAAANPDTILAYEATVVALEAANRVNVIKLAAALERAKALADEIDGFEVVGTLRGTAFASGWEAAQRFISGHVRALLTPKDPGQ